ncbi:MAG: hypothetical protein KF826_04180 [Xanthobacteraceae bacterium]|nr:hypothetical protein [Xanthobacteraceae bacterium]MBX3533527.1 hypothetical protein [Xanthobacteraceae bacterium]MBX3550797.1 hypothetical protein [Xanthobacteraceae bacterium]MCW5675545.1 hypothetical protein [Xanthobacteraceae bacterium]MCW5676467.1 hypothetical protein [Xanthobacteraceae bacterium]
MRGILIHYNAQSEQGLIRAEDGNRYAFYKQDWQSERRPSVNDEVDFEVDGTIAYDIYLLKAGRAPVAASSGPSVDLTKLRETVSRGAQDLGGNPLAQRLLGDWTMVFAVLTLLGCMLPYLTIGGGLFNARTEAASLLGVGSTIGQVIDVTNQIENLGRNFNQRNAQRNAQNVEGLRWSLRLGYLLYLVPIFALWLIVAKVRGKAARNLTIVQGLTSLALPILVPLLFSAAIYAQIPADARQFTQNLGGLVNVSFLGLGFWVMVLAGLAQLLARFGVLRKAPIEFFGAR